MNSVVANGWDILFARIIRGFGMTEMIENQMDVDSEWEEQEYCVPSKARLKRMRLDYEEIEYKEGVEDEE